MSRRILVIGATRIGYDLVADNGPAGITASGRRRARVSRRIESDSHWSMHGSALGCG